MKVSIYYTLEVTAETRLAIRKSLGLEGEATRAEVKEWFEENGSSKNGEISQYNESLI